MRGKGKKPAAPGKPKAAGPAGKPDRLRQAKPDTSLIAVSVLLIAIMAYAIFFYPMKQAEGATYAPEGKECADGQAGQCTVGRCAGTRNCTRGEWSRCVLEMACEPGSLATCYEDACSSGYKVCDECGAGYGPCINNSG